MSCCTAGQSLPAGTNQILAIPTFTPSGTTPAHGLDLLALAALGNRPVIIACPRVSSLQSSSSYDPTDTLQAKIVKQTQELEFVVCGDVEALHRL